MWFWREISCTARAERKFGFAGSNIFHFKGWITYYETVTFFLQNKIELETH
jgi:hypothetical protein